MAAAAMLKITLLAISQPLLHIFVPNLKQRIKLGPAARFTVKILISQKSKMAAADIFDII